LTPSGDDFLCGFLCAAGCVAGESWASALGGAVEAGLYATGAISASFLDCAARGFFPSDLHAAAAAIAEDDESAAAAAIGRVCAYGHSSGADSATGFLYGLAVSAARAAIP
jgi:hypothetical protein